jgi:hypothetical protein
MFSRRWDDEDEETVSRATPFIAEAKLLEVDRRDVELSASMLVMLPAGHGLSVPSPPSSIFFPSKREAFDFSFLKT